MKKLLALIALIAFAAIPTFAAAQYADDCDGDTFDQADAD